MKVAVPDRYVGCTIELAFLQPVDVVGIEVVPFVTKENCAKNSTFQQHIYRIRFI